MNDQFESMSVIELRQKAKELGVKLGAGINKQGIIAKLREASGDSDESAPAQMEMEAAQTAPETEAAPRPIRSAAIITDDEEMEEEDIPVLTPNPLLQSAPRSTPRPVSPVPTGAAAPSGSSLSTISAKAPAFTMEGSRAWHNPRTYQGQNSSYQRPQPAQSWNTRPAPQTPDQRTYRSPASQSHADPRGAQNKPVQQPAYVNRFGPDQGTQETEQHPVQEYRNYNAPQQDNPSFGYGYGGQSSYPRRENSGGMSIADILAAGECGDGEGILEVHPDGYGFLRTNHYLPGKQDVYISNAQIRRFNLRTGDYVAGKTRPQRDADRYSAMLYITEINGGSPEEMPTRSRFEELTPIYPKKRMTLIGKKDNDPALRLIDLLCPIGFGQRAMVLCGSRVDRLALLNKLAASVSHNHSKAELMMLLVDERPEEVTDLKESVQGEVVYATFDEPAENQVRVAEMALERAMRMVEQKKDVVILADSLTRLARACNAIAPQSARAMSGGLAAGALNKPKRFFGAARNTREGGSLTIIITALYDNGSELDQAVLQEFHGNSNMTCAFMQPAGKQGKEPVMQWKECGTIHDEWLLDESEQALADKIRAFLAAQEPETAMDNLLSLLNENETNEALSAALDGRIE